jgi:3-methyl-2-indolic acid synthase
MEAFELDRAALRAARARAEGRAASTEVSDIVARLRVGERPEREALVALFLSRRVSTHALLEIARARRPPGPPRIETFSPLYLSNECDAECAMCGMRRTNLELRRETADSATVDAQLEILHRRGLRGVALLTGEYHHGPRRRAMLARTAAALRSALARGFTHVLINVGALEPEEHARLLDDLPRASDGRVAPQVTMCTFQETYDPDRYARFMGRSPANPRSDFLRRLRNLDRAADAGMWAANPGVLVGLNRDLGYEILALLEHAQHLAERGLTVYVSVPRLRKASGTAHATGASDDAFARLVAVLAIGLPEAKVVISTRESPEMQRRLLPVIGVLTPGSPGVAPYTETGARFEVEASQFEVLDHRPIEAILGEILAAGTLVDRYEPVKRA